MYALLKGTECLLYDHKRLLEANTGQTRNRYACKFFLVCVLMPFLFGCCVPVIVCLAFRFSRVFTYRYARMAQVCSIELIASENFASVAVLEALGSVMTNK